MNDTRNIIDSPKIIDDQETILSVKQSLAEYKAGKYQTLKSDQDIDSFIESIKK